MGKKNFLPVSQHDVEMPLMGGSAAAAAAVERSGLLATMGSGVYKTTVTQNRQGLPKAAITKSWVMKMFSAFTFLGLIFGGTIVGFSFKMIGDNQVGYYDSEPGYMIPGTYFQFPWTREEMRIVDVGIEFLRLKQLSGSLGDDEFMIPNTNVIYNVEDVDTYVATLKDSKSPLYCETEIENAVLDKLMVLNESNFLTLKEMKDIPVSPCGININKVTFSRPIIQQNSLILNMGGTQVLQRNNQKDATMSPDVTMSPESPDVSPDASEEDGDEQTTETLDVEEATEPTTNSTIG